MTRSGENITSILMVGNPQAGRFREATFKGVSAYFRSMGVNVQEILDPVRLPVRKAADKDFNAAIIMGGDGTVNRFINIYGPGTMPIGIIPVGTGNVLARELGIPLKDPLKAASLAMKGKRRAVDLGHVDGRCFLLMSGIGFDGEVAARLTAAHKRVLGLWAYVLASLVTFLRFIPTTVRVETEQGTFSGLGALLCNTERYGGPFCFARGAWIDDGLLDVIIFKKMDLISIFRYLLMAAGYRDQKMQKNLIWVRARTIGVYSSPPAAVQIDGDYFGSTPIHATVMHRSQEFFV
ncbi:MAG: hypothetical protein DRH12_00945 [Deltaproteobacteria bacterium]|nr:MAG: hypothetical protein DRH12_00945 [Deltaproteobacteria bacterium]